MELEAPVRALGHSRSALRLRVCVTSVRWYCVVLNCDGQRRKGGVVRLCSCVGTGVDKHKWAVSFSLLPPLACSS